ncbi:MAG: YHS domain-containing protein [Gemmataceae bacterium]|nr:YHS domain-containing protein [Gemmataceae bacterium]
MPEEKRTDPAPSPRTESLPTGAALKIGVMGGATGVITREHLDKAHQLGRAVAQNGCVLITGACPGLPLAGACGAKQEGGLVIGVSPGLSLDEHVNKYHSPAEFHDVLIFTGSGLMGREVVNIRSSDMVVIIGGRSGTLGELAIAYDEGKLIGVLTGTGGISDMVADILAACAKDTGARVVYEAEPQRLIEEVLRIYRTAHFRRPSCFCSDRPPGEEAVPMPGMESDPVCGMELVPQAAAAERTVDGRRYVFCSTACVERFDADPLKYAPRSMTHV